MTFVSSTATLLLPSYRLRFFREPNTPLRLVYGRADLAPPSYDIELIAPRLLDAPAKEVALLLLIARLVRNP